MAQHNRLYQQALYYDIALSRDVSREVDFIQQVYHHYTGLQLHSILEIACGPGYHTRALAQRGLRAIGLDLQPEMLAFASEQVDSSNLELAWIVADMRSFQLAEPVDMVICMFDGIDPLLSHDDLLQHLQTVAENLEATGLYLIQYTHPRYCSLQDYGSFNYKGERDDISVEIKWATNNPTFDLITAVAEVETELWVHHKDETQVIRDRAKERLVTPQELSLLARLSRVFQIVGWHGDFDLNQPLDNSPASEYMICIMQKHS